MVNIDKTKLMVIGAEVDTSRSKIDSCNMYGRRVMANSILCSNVDVAYIEDAFRNKLLAAVTQTCAIRSSITAGTVVSKEKLCDGVAKVKVFFYLGDNQMQVAILKQL